MDKETKSEDSANDLKSLQFLNTVQ